MIQNPGTSDHKIEQIHEKKKQADQVVANEQKEIENYTELLDLIKNPGYKYEHRDELLEELRNELN